MKNVCNIHIGDSIEFICGSRATTRTVVRKAKYNTFEELLSKEDLQKCLPGVSCLTEAINFYRNLPNHPALESIHGVLSFTLESKVKIIP